MERKTMRSKDVLILAINEPGRCWSLGPISTLPVPILILKIEGHITRTAIDTVGTSLLSFILILLYIT